MARITDFLIPSAVNLGSLLLSHSIFNLTLPLQLFQSPFPPRACLREHVSVCVCLCDACMRACALLWPRLWEGAPRVPGSGGAFSVLSGQGRVLTAGAPCVRLSWRLSPKLLPAFSVSVCPSSHTPLGMPRPPRMCVLSESKCAQRCVCVILLLWSICLVAHAIHLRCLGVCRACVHSCVCVCVCVFTHPAVGSWCLPSRAWHTPCMSCLPVVANCGCWWLVHSEGHGLGPACVCLRVCGSGSLEAVLP